jgi:hypothetical protein
MVFVTSGGVLEYFSEKHLKLFLSKLNSLGKIICVFIEPVATNHNFNLHPNSQPYGWERSFSHNYEKLITNSGFKLWHKSEKSKVLNSKGKVVNLTNVFWSIIVAKN